MKKLLVIAMAVMMTLALASCGGKDNKASSVSSVAPVSSLSSASEDVSSENSLAESSEDLIGSSTDSSTSVAE